MKKSLIALAVMAASGAAMAQSSVTLYGVADLWLGSNKVTATNPELFGTISERSTLLNSGGVATSRVGLKGSEDLGGGLKANFQLEQTITLDNGATSSAFDRQSWLGLSGGFGAVQLGRSWSSYDDIRASANDNFNANVAASFNTWLLYNDRPANSIKYITPEFSGFSGSVTYGLGEDKAINANNKASDLFSLGAQYANGPLFVGFAHQTEKSGANSALPAVASINGLLSVAGLELIVADGTKATYNLLNGSYDFGMAKVVGGVNWVKGTAPDVADTVKAQEFNIGVEVPVASNINLGLGYAQSQLELNGTDIAKTTGFTATALYNLSKRTTVYAVIAQAKAKDNLGLALSAKTQTYAVGVNHKF